MLRKFAGAMLVSSMLAAAGCASSMETPSTLDMSGPTAQAAGSWSGYAGVGAVSTSVSLTLEQSGNNVAGNIDVAGRPDMTGDVVGTVQGNGLQLRLQSGFGSLPLMTVRQDQIVGILLIGPMTLQRSR